VTVFKESMEAISRVIDQEIAEPCAVCLPSCWTSLGFWMLITAHNIIYAYTVQYSNQA